MSNIAGYYDGKPACACQLEWLPVANAEALRLGIVRHKLDIAQLIGGAPKSGGTHTTGAAADFWQTARAFIAWCRQAGARATWHRPHNWDGKGGGAHTHSVLDCPHNTAARYQQDAVDDGYNGLGWMGRGGEDDGPRPLKKRTWKQGIAWAAKNLPVRKIKTTVMHATRDGILGRQYPGVGPITQRRKAKFRMRAVAEYTDPHGRKHYRTKYGTWYAGTDLTTRKPAAPVAKAHSLRIGSWNVALIVKRARLADRLRRLGKQARKRRLDVLGVQERPQKPGTRLDKLLGDLTVRVGKYARYLFFRTGTKIHGSATWDPWKKSPITKWVTSACATVPGDRKRFYVNCHPVSGAQHSKHRKRWAKATIVKSIRRAKKHGLGRESIIFLGDFNGPEFAQVASRFGFVRVRQAAKRRNWLRRTFNAWGAKKNEAGGQFDYILVHESLADSVTLAATINTPKASDHNLTITEIKEI